MAGRSRLVLVAFVTVSSMLVGSPVAAGDPVCTITGTEGDDALVGTAGDDVICGLGGDDTIDAGDGDDVLFGGPGADLIRGGSGDDEFMFSAAADEFMFSAAADEFLSTTDGLSWEFNTEPLGGLTAMATHNGLVFFSDYYWQEIGVQEGPIQTWDGATTEVLVDPNPAMAWTSFVSDGETLWMAGFRDIDDYSQDVVEAGVYASTNGIDRVSITTGITDLEGYIPKMILWQPTP